MMLNKSFRVIYFHFNIFSEKNQKTKTGVQICITVVKICIFDSFKKRVPGLSISHYLGKARVQCHEIKILQIFLKRTMQHDNGMIDLTFKEEGGEGGEYPTTMQFEKRS